MICIKCGKEIEDGSRFCGFCGIRIDKPQADNGNQDMELPVSTEGELLTLFGMELLPPRKSDMIIIGETRVPQLDSFEVTKQVTDYMDLDEVNSRVKFNVPSYSLLLGITLSARVYHYQDIIGFELIENNGAISKGGFGGAVAGGMLFGGAGAVAGSVLGKKQQSSCNNLAVRITVNDSTDPMVMIYLITQPTAVNSVKYKTARNDADKMMTQLQYICSLNDTRKGAHNYETQVSVADELIKYKSLLDEGIITQAEFDKKKKELLR